MSFEKTYRNKLVSFTFSELMLVVILFGDVHGLCIHFQFQTLNEHNPSRGINIQNHVCFHGSLRFGVPKFQVDNGGLCQTAEARRKRRVVRTTFNS